MNIIDTSLKIIGSAGNEIIQSLSGGSDGSTYVVGSTTGNLDNNVQVGGFDAFISKYNRSGQKLWTKTFGTDTWDSAYSVKVAPDGSVYIGGYTFGAIFNGEYKLGGEDDGFLIKIRGCPR